MIAMRGLKVAVVLKGYPRLSETFIAQEIRALEKRGLRTHLISLRRPTDPFTHPIHRQIKAPVSYLPEYLYQHPVRVVTGLLKAYRRPGFATALRIFMKDLKRDLTFNRIRRFGQAAVLAAEHGDDISHIYSHFLHTPSSVARYAAIMLGLPWSFSAHAKDIWTIPEWEKREKIADAIWGTTCTAYGYAHLVELAPEHDRDKIFLSYHGLDLTCFPAPPDRTGEPDGSNADRPVIIVSVGRAVAKKGYDTLLSALSGIPRDINWRFVHVGGGPLLGALKKQARALGLEQNIDWLGARDQGVVIDTLKNGHLFVLACRVDDDGDRDGLPNVLLEAQSQLLPCISTDITAIPEFIESGTTGILVAPGDPEALARAMIELIANPSRRRSLADAGYRRLVADFSAATCIARLTDRFGLDDEI